METLSASSIPYFVFGEAHIISEPGDAFVAHLKHVHDAERVEMNRVQHGLATVPEVREGMKLNDPSLYRDLTEHATSDVSDVTPSPATRGPTP